MSEAELGESGSSDIASHEGLDCLTAFLASGACE